MSFDEHIFQYFWNWKKNWKKKNLEKDLVGCIPTKDFEKIIQILTFFVLEHPIQVCEAEGAGGFIGSSFFMPNYFSAFKNPQLKTAEINYKALIYRSLFSAAQLRLMTPLPYGQWQSARRSELQKESLELVHQFLENEFPNFKSLKEQILHWEKIESEYLSLTANEENIFQHYLRGLYPLYSPQSEEMALTANTEHKASQPMTEKKGKSKEFATKTEYQETEENPVMHILEKVHTAEEYSGNQRQMDGSDELEDHQDALDELNMRELIRTNTTSHSMYKTDLQFSVDPTGANQQNAPADAQSKIFKYDEWQTKKQSYLKNWCQLIELQPPERTEHLSFEAPNLNDIRKLKQLFWEYLKKTEWIPRQLDGFELDLEAIIDRQVDFLTKKDPTEKIYKFRKNSFKDLSSVFLFDTSLSTDSFVQNHRVIDLEKKSIRLLGEALKDLKLKIEVSGFFSESRHAVTYQIVKSFEDNWVHANQQLSYIHPQGYTRIGPALRHAIYRLHATDSEKKMILLFTDAKPTDFDAYEGVHGIQDVAKAVSEARRLGIDIFAVTLDKAAQSHFTQMFGRNKFCVVNHPNDLANELMKIYMSALT